MKEILDLLDFQGHSVKTVHLELMVQLVLLETKEVVAFRVQ